MTNYQCATCGGLFTATPSTAEEVQTQHRHDNWSEHKNTMTFPPIEITE